MRTSQQLCLRHYLLLAIACVVLFLPGLSRLPPLDRDESRYMEATAQMLRSGNFIDVRFQDQPRYLQPAGIYWLESASVALLSSPEAKQAWAYRMPSFLCAIASVLLTAGIGARLVGRASGIAAGLLLAVCVLLSVEARMATIDSTLLAAILTAQSALARIFVDREQDRPRRLAPAFIYWTALGVGLMLKGPLILLVCWGTLLGLLVAERRTVWLRRLYPAWGIPLMLAIVVPWCVAISVVSHGDFFARSVGHNFLGKVASGQQAHGMPPGYYIVVFALSFWPGSLFAALAVPFVWRNRRAPAVRFLLAWIIPTWITFELVATKLPHYVLPTYPAIACLAAAAAFGNRRQLARSSPLAPSGSRGPASAVGPATVDLVGDGASPSSAFVPAGPWSVELPGRRGWRWAGHAYAAIWSVIAFGLALGGPVLLWRVEHIVSAGAIIGGVVAISGAMLALVAVRRRRPIAAWGCASAGALAVFVSVYGFSLPALRTIWLSPRIAAAVQAVRPCPDSVVASSSFSEPSLVFLVGQQTELVNAVGAADFLAAHRACGLALIGSRDTPTFMARMAANAVMPQALQDIRGINYSTGKHLTLTLYSAQH